MNDFVSNLRNINMDFATTVVFQGIFIGIIIAVLTVGYNKLVIGRFVKALINAEANHPAFAKSFSDLNIKKTIFLRHALRGYMLQKIVAKLEEDTDEEIKYYIPEDKLYRAGRLYGGKDVDVLLIAAVILVLFLFFGLVLLYFPMLLNFTANLLEIMFG